MTMIDFTYQDVGNVAIQVFFINHTFPWNFDVIFHCFYLSIFILSLN